MLEMERKYLVNSLDFLSEYSCKNHIAQGYLNSNPHRNVRIRIKNNKGYITIKGMGNDSGISRFEWENEIPVLEAQQLLKLCEKGIIEKTRYEVTSDKHTIEIDVFHGDNDGLILAEIELQNENDTIIKPHWLGIEVTNDQRYYNAFLFQKPFKSW